MDWVRNETARSLAAGSSTFVGIVLVDLRNSLFVDIAREAESTYRADGRRVLIEDSDVDQTGEREAIDAFQAARVAGVLLAPLDTPTVSSSTGMSGYRSSW